VQAPAGVNARRLTICLNSARPTQGPAASSSSLCSAAIGLADLIVLPWAIRASQIAPEKARQHIMLFDNAGTGLAGRPVVASPTADHTDPDREANPLKPSYLATEQPSDLLAATRGISSLPSHRTVSATVGATCVLRRSRRGMSRHNEPPIILRFQPDRENTNVLPQDHLQGRIARCHAGGCASPTGAVRREVRTCHPRGQQPFIIFPAVAVAILPPRETCD